MKLSTLKGQRMRQTLPAEHTSASMPGEQTLTDVITKRSGIQETLKELENIGHKVLPVILAALKDLLQGPAVFHIIQTELMGLAFCDSY